MICEYAFCWCNTIKTHFNGLAQERRNSITNALQLRLSCTNPPFILPRWTSVHIQHIKQLPWNKWSNFWHFAATDAAVVFHAIQCRIFPRCVVISNVNDQRIVIIICGVTADWRWLPWALGGGPSSTTAATGAHTVRSVTSWEICYILRS